MNHSSAEQILDLARKRFDAAEVFEQMGEALAVSFEDSRLKSIESQQFHGVGLRVIADGRIGFASTTDLRDPALLVEMAAHSAKYGDVAKFALPAQPAGIRPPETFDERVLGVSAERMVEMGRVGLEMSLQANRDYLYSCSISRAAGSQRIVNTSGLDFSYRSSSMGASVGVQEIGPGGLLEIHEFKDWAQPFDSVADLMQTVLDKMRQASTVAPARAEAMPMIFAPKALGNLLMPVEIALNGKQVHKGASVLRGRIGEQVLDPRITITDDPTIPFAPASRALDDEGTPTRPTDLFKDGVLKTYIADLETASLLGIAPTGHGSRSYASRPSPSLTNTVVSAGETSLADMTSGMKRGLIIDQTLGSGQSNLLAGEISVNVEVGFLVEDGRVRGRVKDCMVAGNVYDLLNRIEAISKERQWLGSSCVPAIMVSGIKLAVQG